MGRKGVNKRKPKQNSSHTNNKNGNPANVRPGASSPVQALVNHTGNTPGKDNGHPAAGSNKKVRNGR
jgi:hypothetical protein